MSITEVPAYNRILVGTDGSLLAEPTIVRAAGLAAANGADVVIVCAYTTLSPRESASQEASAAQVATLGQVPGAATATKALEEAVAIVEQHGARVAAALLVDAEPAVALLEAAKQYEVDALVLGAIRDRRAPPRERGIRSRAQSPPRRAHCAAPAGLRRAQRRRGRRRRDPGDLTWGLTQRPSATSTCAGRGTSLRSGPAWRSSTRDGSTKSSPGSPRSSRPQCPSGPRSSRTWTRSAFCVPTGSSSPR